VTHRRTNEQKGIRMQIARFSNSLLDLNETLIFYRDFQKPTKHFSISCLVRRDRQREGGTLWIEFHNFGTPLQTRCTSIEYLRNFWRSYGKCNRYHITVCPVRHRYTRGPLDDTNALKSESHNFKYHVEIYSFQISLQRCLVTFLITSLPLLSWHFQFIIR
jgi:hypothetical protein